MRKLLLVGLFFILGCEAKKSGSEAALAFAAQISNGFVARGGVLVAKDHVLGHVGAVPASGEAELYGLARPYKLGLVRREGDFGLLRVQGKLEGFAPLGDSGALTEGAKLFFVAFDEAGKAAVRSAKVTGFRAHEGRSYIELSATAPKEISGGGVFDAGGGLVGLVAFSLGEGLTYVLPIEYLTSGPKAVAGSLAGIKEPSAAFARRRDEAKGSPAPLEAPLTYGKLQFEQRYSRTALVGRVTMLREPGASLVPSYKLEGIDERRARRVIAEGSIPAGEFRFVSLDEQKEAVIAATGARFGASYVKQHIAPYDYVELRYRLPFSLFCHEVNETEVHALTISLSDDRKSEEIAFADLVNICAAIEDGEGSALEKEWGLGAKAPGKKARAKPYKKRRR